MMDEIKPTANELHDSAMDVSEEAQGLYRKALRLERQALDRVMEVLPAGDREPTFSILCSSAAWLAFNANLPHSAIELAERGLAEGKPSDYHRHGLEWVIEWSKRMIEEKG